MKSNLVLERTKTEMTHAISQPLLCRLSRENGRKTNLKAFHFGKLGLDLILPDICLVIIFLENVSATVTK